LKGKFGKTKTQKGEKKKLLDDDLPDDLNDLAALDKKEEEPIRKVSIDLASTESAAAAPEVKKSSSSKWIFIVIGLVLVLGLAGAGFVVLTGGIQGDAKTNKDVND